MYEYIEQVLDYETDLWLSPTEIDFLQRIGQRPCSTYNIFIELKTPRISSGNEGIYAEDIKILSRRDPERIGNGIAYKNVLRRIQKLLKLRLIRETKSTQANPHKAKIYEITSKGLFYLIHFKLFSLRIDDLTQYHGDVILETILFPYFEDKTLKRCTTRFMSTLALYLGECCEITLTEVKRLREETNTGEKQRIANLLMTELKGAAKSMVVRMLNMDHATEEKKARVEQTLAINYPNGDKKFARLVNKVKKDLDQWYAMDISRV